jgi:3-oxoacyl-[acyl-carrier-protein] synthase III
MASADIDAATGKYLADKYAIVGVGETEYLRGAGSGRSTRAMGTAAIRAALNDAGMKAGDVDGIPRSRHSWPAILASG